MVFHWRLSDSKSPQVSRTLLSILVVYNNVVVWMVSTRPPTSKSSRHFNNPLVTMPKAPITIGIIVTFMFHRFFNSLARLMYYYYYYYFTPFKSWSLRDSKSPLISSEYSNRSQQCSSLDSLNSCSEFQLFQFLFQTFWDRSNHATYYWY